MICRSDFIIVKVSLLMFQHSSARVYLLVSHLLSVRFCLQNSGLCSDQPNKTIKQDSPKATVESAIRYTVVIVRVPIYIS